MGDRNPDLHAELSLHQELSTFDGPTISKWNNTVTSSTHIECAEIGQSIMIEEQGCVKVENKNSIKSLHDSSDQQDGTTGNKQNNSGFLENTSHSEADEMAVEKHNISSVENTSESKAVEKHNSSSVENTSESKAVITVGKHNSSSVENTSESKAVEKHNSSSVENTSESKESKAVITVEKHNSTSVENTSKSKSVIAVEKHNSSSVENTFDSKTVITVKKHNSSSVENTFESEADGSAVIKKKCTNSNGGSCDVKNMDYIGNAGREESREQHTDDIPCDRTSLRKEVKLGFSSCGSEIDDSAEEMLEITLSDYCSDEEDMDISIEKDEPHISNREHNYSCNTSNVNTTDLSSTDSDVKNVKNIALASGTSNHTSNENLETDAELNKNIHVKVSNISKVDGIGNKSVCESPRSEQRQEKVGSFITETCLMEHDLPEEKVSSLSASLGESSSLPSASSPSEEVSADLQGLEQRQEGVGSFMTETCLMEEDLPEGKVSSLSASLDESSTLPSASSPSEEASADLPVISGGQSSSSTYCSASEQSFTSRFCSVEKQHDPPYDGSVSVSTSNKNSLETSVSTCEQNCDLVCDSSTAVPVSPQNCPETYPKSQQNGDKINNSSSRQIVEANMAPTTEQCSEGNYDSENDQNNEKLTIPTDRTLEQLSSTILSSAVNPSLHSTKNSSSPSEQITKAVDSCVDSSGGNSEVDEVISRTAIEEQTSISSEKLPESHLICPQALGSVENQAELLSSCELDMECDAADDSRIPSSEFVVTSTEQSPDDYESEGQTLSQCDDSTSIVQTEGADHDSVTGSTTLNVLENQSHIERSQPVPVEQTPPSNKVEMVASISKTIKSEPVDDGYEQTKKNLFTDTKSKNTNMPVLVIGGKVKTEVLSPTHSDAAKPNACTNDSTQQKCVLKSIAPFQKQKVIKTKLPGVLPSVDVKKKIPVAIMNTAFNGPGLPCSYIIPIHTSFANASQYQTFVKSTSNGKPVLKKINFLPAPKDVKKKVQQSKMLLNKNQSTIILPQVPMMPDTLTLKIPVSGGGKVYTETGKFGIRSIDIAKKSVMPAGANGNKTATDILNDFRLKSFDIAGISQLVQRKNIIKAYKAPNPPSKLQLIKITYVCTECGDSFLLESSLKDHFARCSMAIQYHCRACQMKLLFTNKCSLLKHLRCHSKSPDQLARGALQIQADNISVLSVLEGNMPKIDKQSVVEQYKKVKIIQTMKKNPCPECGQETHLKISHHFGSLGVICNFKHMCKDCSMYLPTACSLSAHQRIHSFKEPLVCPECGKIFASINSFKTHIKTECYHFNRAPIFVCPICNVFVCSASSLKEHFVMEHQKIIYWDKNCHEVFATYQQYLEHRDEFHSRSVSTRGVSFYCEICKTNLLLKMLINHMYSHITTIKQNIPFGYVCIDCRDEKKVSRIFFVKKDLMKHLELHKEGQHIPCSRCSLMFVTQDELKEHEAETHKATDEKVCKHCKVPVDNMKSHLKHCEFASIAALFENTVSPDYSKMMVMFPPEKLSSVLETLNKNGCIAKRKLMEEKIKIDVNEFACKYCGDQNSKTLKQFARHTNIHVRDGVLICNKCQRKDFKSFGEMKSHQIVCGLHFNCIDDASNYWNEDVHCKDCDKYFKDNTALKKHVKEEHAFYPCHLCGLTYSTDDGLDLHMNTVHRGKKSISLSCRLCKGKKGRGKTFMRRDFYYNHMETVHGISESSDQASLLSKRKGESTESGSPLKRLKVSDTDKYSCAKCEFSTANSDEFSDHIAKHKTDDSIQCPNCGLCFSVVPAVKRHLQLVHRIQNVDQFIEDKGLQVPEEEEEEEDDDTSFLEEPKTSADLSAKYTEQISDNPRECPVCKKIFDTQAEKKFHMRTHGMAFISSRRRELSAKPAAPSGEEQIDVVKCEDKSPEKSVVSDSHGESKPSPISLTKRVKLSDKNKILQPANQPVVNVERMDINK